MTLTDYMEYFRTEEDCKKHMFNIKYKKDYSCKNCGNSEYWITDIVAVICKGCRRKRNLASDTFFKDTNWYKKIRIEPVLKNV